ncbi:unnamed protein product [Sphacelaria rigidula]
MHVPEETTTLSYSVIRRCQYFFRSSTHFLSISNNHRCGVSGLDIVNPGSCRIYTFFRYCIRYFLRETSNPRPSSGRARSTEGSTQLSPCTCTCLILGYGELDPCSRITWTLVGLSWPLTSAHFQ